MEIGPDPKILMKLVTMRMPFGKHKGKLLCDLPEDYLIWFNHKGMPEGKLGEYMLNVYTMKVNGLDSMLDKLKTMVPSQEEE